MKRLPQLFAFIILIAVAIPAGAATTGYAKCESYDSYVMFYRSLEQFDVQGKIKCGEGFEILSRWNEYFSIRTPDGKQGWVPELSVTLVPPAAKPPVSPPPALTNENVVDMLRLKFPADVIIARIKASACDFDTSPVALKQLKKSLVPDRLIQVMAQAPLATPPPAAKAEPTESPSASYIPR